MFTATYVSVPVTVDDNGVMYETSMVASSVGIKLSTSRELFDISQTHKSYPETCLSVPGSNFSIGVASMTSMTPEVSDVTGLDSMQPVTSWWMYNYLKQDDKKTQPDPTDFALP
ncbi:hypothetical protein HD806DRAFT_389639 [Xylariaceae sp. AK1471]|nr:hypothetical protein HD806DRAFT_389639 [Xylariaceae sp. AK1471]